MMASKFLTNTGDGSSLSELVRGLTKSSSKLDFLVGYFFFSGFCEIYKDIAADKPLRILVGMDAEVDLNNCIFEYTTTVKDNPYSVSKLGIRQKYFENLKKMIAKADILDSADFEKSYHLFLEKLENGTLEVRKTKDPNHAKMYLFYIPKEKSDDGKNKGKVIVGSSNFSIQGFKNRQEINVYLQDEHDYEDGAKIFEELWKDALPLVNKENKDDFKKDVLAHTWLEARPNPYLMYIRVLDEYFKISKDDHIKTPWELTRGRINTFLDMSYQVDAIREGVAKLKKHSGVIIADVVGLGKSIVASSIAANIDKHTIIITPPHLKALWEDYAADFGLRGCKIYTSGKIQEAAEENKNISDLVIIIDEAHRYRNEATESYSQLHRLCAGNQVILLSATPFNNRPEDIFSLIKLFQIPSNSTIQTVNDLGNQMAQIIGKYKKLKEEHRENSFSEREFNEKSTELAQKIRDILDPVIIRRTRIDLEKIEKYQSDLAARGVQFSDVRPPKSQHYDLGALTDLYQETLTLLTDEKKGFTGARYKPLTYLKTDSRDKHKIDKKLEKKYSTYFDDLKNFASGQLNMADFMKRLLVRRFESSKYSFIQTLKNVRQSMETIRRWHNEVGKIPMAEQSKIPDIDEIEATIEDDQEELFSEKELFSEAAKEYKTNKSGKKQKGVWYIDASDISEDFLKDLDADIRLIQEFLEKWEATDFDPKLDAIKDELKRSLRQDSKRKIIIFTEFADTADYLAEKFRSDGLRTMMYSSRCATKSAQADIRENFDAGCPKNSQKNDFDILVATDAISEGFSLHRAGTIYNYDIPYNPTRVIQRVGRINRINKKVFDELYIYNFFPTAQGEEIGHTKEISTFKMKLFQAILGGDTQILTEDETIDGYFGREYTAAENEANALSWDVEFRNELARIETEEKELLAQAQALPQRCRIARKNVNYIMARSEEPELFEGIKEKGVLLFSRKGDAYRFCFSAKDGSAQMVTPQQALTLFKATKEEKAESVSDAFYIMYERAKSESGVVKTTRQKSRAAQKVLTILGMLRKNNDINDFDKSYIETLRNIIEWDAMPEYYMKQIARMEKEAANPQTPAKQTLEKIKIILPEQYLETIRQKNYRVGHEPETILLAEELL